MHNYWLTPSRMHIAKNMILCISVYIAIDKCACVCVHSPWSFCFHSPYTNPAAVRYYLLLITYYITAHTWYYCMKTLGELTVPFGWHAQISTSTAATATKTPYRHVRVHIHIQYMKWRRQRRRPATFRSCGCTMCIQLVTQLVKYEFLHFMTRMETWQFSIFLNVLIKWKIQ